MTVLYSSFQILSNSKYYIRHRILFSLSNEMLFKKIRCEMADKKQKNICFFKNSVSRSKKTYFSLKVWLLWFLNKDYPMDIMEFKGRVAITDKICPLEKIHFFYVKRSRRVSESEF